MQEKNKMAQKNNMASKIVEKKIFWTHIMEMIPFYLIFPNVVGGGGGGAGGGKGGDTTLCKMKSINRINCR